MESFIFVSALIKGLFLHFIVDWRIYLSLTVFDEDYQMLIDLGEPFMDPKLPFLFA